MDIQMILSALPGKPMGKAEPDNSTQGGHFALALANAGQSRGDHASDLAAQLADGATTGMPHTMAAQQALLQALAHHDAATEHGLASADSLPLDEIMERLALIESTHRFDPRQLPEKTPDVTEVPPEDSEAVILAALAANEGLRHAMDDPARPLEARSGAARSGDVPPPPAGLQDALRQGRPSPGHEAADTSQRQNAPIERDTRSANPPLRSIEFSRSADLPPASPLGGNELRVAMPETARAGLMPAESINPLAPQAGHQPGTSAAQPMPAQASLATQVQSQAWPGQLGQQLIQFARLGGEQRIEMQLHPAELGPLSITLKMTEQGAQAQFLSAHAQVRQVIEQAIPQLRDALAEQGITLGDTSVGEQRQQDAQAFAGQDGQRQGGPGLASDADDALSDMAEPGMADSAIGMTLDGRVNLYA
ncbi:flagellar hook-length control protein FliK [Billgrantia endophytica]|nr:flagellar hook-length control protein FliK [Halomonas endophytica]